METLTLTTPVQVTGYQVQKVVLDWANARIKVVVRDTNSGENIIAAYAGTTATNLMSFLNTANLSTTSLHARILNRLVTDGFLPAGTVTGTPA